MRINLLVILLGLAANALARGTPTIRHAIRDDSQCGAAASDYTVVGGDTLTKIADAYKIPLCYLEQANPQIANFNYINVGDVIHIPAQPCVPPPCSSAAPKPGPTANCSNTDNSTYTVVQGDTLYIIATEKFGITLASLEGANPQIADFNVIEIGQVINIPLCLGTCAHVTNDKYTVVAGDTLYTIATEKFKITLAALEAVNRQIPDYNSIFPFEVINIPICDPKGCPRLA